jgi:hypothetical protein
LEYRRPAPLVSREEADSDLIPISSLPVSSTPAREEDLQRYPDFDQAQQVRYVATAAATPPIHQTNYQPAPVCNCPQPASGNYVQYVPAPTYALPNYNQPVVGSPYTVYSPVAPLAPAVQPNVQVGAGIYGQPVIYRPGQPLRNAWRWLTP